MAIIYYYGLLVMHAELGDGDLVTVGRLFSQSFFILPTMLQTWQSALDEFKRNRLVNSIALRLVYLVNHQSLFHFFLKVRPLCVSPSSLP